MFDNDVAYQRSLEHTDGLPVYSQLVIKVCSNHTMTSQLCFDVRKIAEAFV